MTPEKHDIASLLSVTTLKNTDLSGKTIVLRLDLNMPMAGDKVLDTSRLDASLETIRILLQTNARLIIVTHRGRPKGIEGALSVKPFLPLLEKVLHTSVLLANTVHDLKMILASDFSQKIILLENIRFWSEETDKNEAAQMECARVLRSLSDVYVNEAFSVSHRAHLSVYTLPLCFEKHQRYAGLTFEKEVSALNTILHQSEHSTLITLLGGGKVSTKMGLLQSLLERSHAVILGGGMANTFLTAKGMIPKGKSLIDEDFLKEAESLYDQYAHKIILPVDAVIASEDRSSKVLSVREIDSDQAIVDIGPETLHMIKNTLHKTISMRPTTTILWNGPFGWIEKPPFDQGSKDIGAILAECTKNHDATTIVGGGETLSCLRENRVHITFASTAGGAFLEYLEKGALPGVEVLRKI